MRCEETISMLHVIKNVLSISPRGLISAIWTMENTHTQFENGNMYFDALLGYASIIELDGFIYGDVHHISRPIDESFISKYDQFHRSRACDMNTSIYNVTAKTSLYNVTTKISLYDYDDELGTVTINFPIVFLSTGMQKRWLCDIDKKYPGIGILKIGNRLYDKDEGANLYTYLVKRWGLQKKTSANL